MTAALATFALVLCGQAPETFTLKFDGFESTQSMKADQLTLLMRAAFEAVSDEPDSRFGVVDSGNADVIVTATQRIDGEQLVFAYFLTTTKCPVRTTNLDQRLPKKAVTTEEARGMARAVAAKAFKLIREEVGEQGFACLEPGESMGGTASVEPDPSLDLPPSSGASGGYMLGGYPMGGYMMGGRPGFDGHPGPVGAGSPPAKGSSAPGSGTVNAAPPTPAGTGATPSPTTGPSVNAFSPQPMPRGGAVSGKATPILQAPAPAPSGSKTVNKKK